MRHIAHVVYLSYSACRRSMGADRSANTSARVQELSPLPGNDARDLAEIVVRTADNSPLNARDVRCDNRAMHIAAPIAEFFFVMLKVAASFSKTFLGLKYLVNIIVKDIVFDMTQIETATEYEALGDTLKFIFRLFAYVGIVEFAAALVCRYGFKRHITHTSANVEEMLEVVSTPIILSRYFFYAETGGAIPASYAAAILVASLTYALLARFSGGIGTFHVRSRRFSAGYHPYWQVLNKCLTPIYFAAFPLAIFAYSLDAVPAYSEKASQQTALIIAGCLGSLMLLRVAGEAYIKRIVVGASYPDRDSAKFYGMKAFAALSMALFTMLQTPDTMTTLMISFNMLCGVDAVNIYASSCWMILTTAGLLSLAACVEVIQRYAYSHLASNAGSLVDLGFMRKHGLNFGKVLDPAAISSQRPYNEGSLAIDLTSFVEGHRFSKMVDDLRLFIHAYFKVQFKGRSFWKLFMEGKHPDVLRPLFLLWFVAKADTVRGAHRYNKEQKAWTLISTFYRYSDEPLFQSALGLFLISHKRYGLVHNDEKAYYARAANLKDYAKKFPEGVTVLSNFFAGGFEAHIGEKIIKLKEAEGAGCGNVQITSEQLGKYIADCEKIDLAQDLAHTLFLSKRESTSLGMRYSEDKHVFYCDAGHKGQMWMKTLIAYFNWRLKHVDGLSVARSNTARRKPVRQDSEPEINETLQRRGESPRLLGSAGSATARGARGSTSGTDSSSSELGADGYWSDAGSVGSDASGFSIF